MNALQIHFVPAKGSIVRILGMIERRGFRLRDVTVRDEDLHGSIIVDLEPLDPMRRLDVLARQLGRLIEVKAVSLETSTAGPYS